MPVPDYVVAIEWFVWMAISTYLVRRFMRKRNVTWQKELAIALPLPHATSTVERLLTQTHGCKLLDKEGLIRLYARGDRNLSHVDCKDVKLWHTIPILATVRCYLNKAGQPRARIAFCSWPELWLTMRAAESFRVMARREFLELRQQLQEEVNRLACSPPGPPDLTHAYAALKLEPSASWTDVQVAYRDVVRQFHPDKLAKLNLPTPLDELVKKEIKIKTEAYRAIKQHYLAQSSRITDLNELRSNQELHTSS